MIQINFRKNNQIITISSEGKAPILVRRSSASFYSPLELLCVSVGSCFALDLWYLCYYRDVNPELFDAIYVDLVDSTIIIHVYHPKLPDEFISSIYNLINTCAVSSLLSNIPTLSLHEINSSKEEIIKKNNLSTCCGG